MPEKKCKIEVYEVIPKGIGGLLQSMKSFSFILALQNQESGEMEVYSKENCEFEPGLYITMVFDPYNGGKIGTGIVKLTNECTYIIISYSVIAGSAYTQMFDDKDKFVLYSNKKTLQRPRGFEVENVERLINDLVKYGHL